MRESEFQEDVETYLRDRFPSADIYKEEHINGDRFPDFLVAYNEYRIMVEVENKAGDVADGIKQAQMYAWADTSASAMVVYPEGTGAVDPEVKGMNPSVGIVSL